MGNCQTAYVPIRTSLGNLGLAAAFQVRAIAQRMTENMSIPRSSSTPAAGAISGRFHLKCLAIPGSQSVGVPESLVGSSFCLIFFIILFESLSTYFPGMAVERSYEHEIARAEAH